MKRRTRYYLMSYTSALAAMLVVWAGVFSDSTGDANYQGSHQLVSGVVLSIGVY